ncbi:LURP-one-related [Dillenia turbinata]|uniref:LURP-one-related n=1 Tax=Dillenia turbinata TaxID=194707 RepID=A0AAN8WAP3_9MAGN
MHEHEQQVVIRILLIFVPDHPRLLCMLSPSTMEYQRLNLDQRWDGFLEVNFKENPKPKPIFTMQRSNTIAGPIFNMEVYETGDTNTIREKYEVEGSYVDPCCNICKIPNSSENWSTELIAEIKRHNDPETSGNNEFYL